MQDTIPPAATRSEDPITTGDQSLPVMPVCAYCGALGDPDPPTAYGRAWAPPPGHTVLPGGLLTCPHRPGRGPATANRIVIDLAESLRRLHHAQIPARAVVVPLDAFPAMTAFQGLPVIHTGTSEWGVIV